MATASRIKSSDKQKVCRKIVSILRKRYVESVPKQDRRVLETMMYAVCLENASASQADSAYDRLGTLFHDLNEIRVSSVSELEIAFDKMVHAAWRALRVKYILQYVFENRFAFDFESLGRKTLELARKQLTKIKYLSPFVRSYTLQVCLGSHVVPLDDRMCRAAIWLGLVEPGTSPEKGSVALKSAVRKAETLTLCHYLRCLASDATVIKEFDCVKKSPPEDGFDLLSAPDRLNELLQQAKTRGKRKSARKKTAKKTTRRSAKKATKKATKKVTVRKKKQPAREKLKSQTRAKRTRAKTRS